MFAAVASTRHGGYNNDLDIDLSVHGLTCRGGCSKVFYVLPAEASDAALFVEKCSQRLAHEERLHGYHHQSLIVKRPEFVWSKKRVGIPQ